MIGDQTASKSIKYSNNAQIAVTIIALKKILKFAILFFLSNESSKDVTYNTHDIPIIKYDIHSIKVINYL